MMSSDEFCKIAVWHALLKKIICSIFLCNHIWCLFFPKNMSNRNFAELMYGCALSPDPPSRCIGKDDIVASRTLNTVEHLSQQKSRCLSIISSEWPFSPVRIGANTEKTRFIRFMGRSPYLKQHLRAKSFGQMLKFGACLGGGDFRIWGPGRFFSLVRYAGFQVLLASEGILPAQAAFIVAY